VRQVPTERTLRAVSALLAVVGIGVAIYITIADAQSGSPVCLAGGHGCATVAKSRYSHLAGIDVSVFGIFGYVLIGAAALLPGDLGRFGGFLLALIGFGFSVYLTYLEVFVIDAICQWCVASAIVMTLQLVVTAARAFAYAGAELGAPGTAGVRDL
jgi:uncharacterized membrane protein